MTIKTGMNAQIGFGDETTWGVAVTPTIFVPLLNESLGQQIERIESDAIIPGARVLRSQEWSEGAVTAGGDIGLELYDRSMGLLLKHMFGGSSTTGPFTPADLTGLGLTAQVGVPDTATGTVRPKTYAGNKVASWELGLTARQIATLGLSLVARHEIRHRTVADGATTNGSTTITSATAAFVADDAGKPISGTNIPAGATIASVTNATTAVLSAAATATGSGLAFTIGLALTAPSYAAGIAPMTYVGGSLTIAGAAYQPRQVTLSGDNGFGDERTFVGQRTVSEPLEGGGRRVYGGTIDSEYLDNVAYNRFIAGAEFPMVLRIARGAAAWEITTNVRFDGETPKVAGRGVVGQMLPFRCVGPTTDAGAITVALA